MNRVVYAVYTCLHSIFYRGVNKIKAHKSLYYAILELSVYPVYAVYTTLGNFMKKEEKWGCCKCGYIIKMENFCKPSVNSVNGVNTSNNKFYKSHNKAIYKNILNL